MKEKQKEKNKAQMLHRGNSCFGNSTETVTTMV